MFLMLFVGRVKKTDKMGLKHSSQQSLTVVFCAFGAMGRMSDLLRD